MMTMSASARIFSRSRMACIFGTLLLLVIRSSHVCAAEDPKESARQAGKDAVKAAEDEQKKEKEKAKPKPDIEIVTTATRAETDVRDVPQSVTVVTEKEVRHRQNRAPNQILSETPGIWTTQVNAQGSPIIRGFIGNRVVYLWDGIRINNGALFGGPNGFFNQFPMDAIERMEVIRGPGAVQYGSDAMGGVINVISRQPVFSKSGGFEYSGDAGGYYGTVDNSGLESANVSFSGKHVAFVGGITNQNVDDYRGPGEGELSPSGFDALGGYASLAYKIADGHVLKASWIQNRRDNVDNYVQSKLNADGIPRLFTPTERRGIAKLDYNATDQSPLSKDLHAYAYFQYYDQLRERRVDTPTGGSANFTNTISPTHQDVFGGGVQNITPIGKHRVIYGMDYRVEDLATSNLVYRTAYSTGRTTKTKQVGKTPDGEYDVFDVFGSAEVRPIDDLILTAGVRYERSHLNADPGPNDISAGSGLTLDDIDLEHAWHSFTWSTGALYKVRSDLDLAANIATAYRAPTYSDILSFGAPVFNSGIASIQTPSPDFRPEQSISFEFGPRYHGSRFSASLTGFLTKLRDFSFRTTQGTVTIGPVTYDAQVTTNKSRGVIKGFEAEASVRIIDGLSAVGNLSYAEGRDTFRDDWFRFIPPLHGMVGIRYEAPSGRWWAEGDQVFTDRFRRPAHDDEGDAGFSIDPALGSRNTTNNRQLRTDYTIPGWTITNLRAGVTAWKDSKRSFDITLDVYNVFNVRYREVYSQQQKVAPGTNAVIGARFHW